MLLVNTDDHFLRIYAQPVFCCGHLQQAVWRWWSDHDHNSWTCEWQKIIVVTHDMRDCLGRELKLIESRGMHAGLRFHVSTFSTFVISYIADPWDYILTNPNSCPLNWTYHSKHLEALPFLSLLDAFSCFSYFLICCHPSILWHTHQIDSFKL